MRKDRKITRNMSLAKNNKKKPFKNLRDKRDAKKKKQCRKSDTKSIKIHVTRSIKTRSYHRKSHGTKKRYSEKHSAEKFPPCCRLKERSTQILRNGLNVTSLSHTANNNVPASHVNILFFALS